MHTLMETTLAATASASPPSAARGPVSHAPAVSTNTPLTAHTTASTSTAAPSSLGGAGALAVSFSATPSGDGVRIEDVLADSPLPSSLPTPSQVHVCVSVCVHVRVDACMS